MKKTLSDDVRDRLKWVRTGQGPVDLSGFPDFLVIGPQRTGTSWLFSNLFRHPDIMMPPSKEILFFNRLKDPDNPRFKSNDLGWYTDHFRDSRTRFLRKTLDSLRSHGRLYRPRHRGEASASYAAMDPDLIDELVLINPGIKAILMVRDPIERAWSHAVKDLARDAGRRLEDVPDAEIEAFLRRPYQRRCASYVENHDKWAERLRPGHVFVGDFDDVKRRPKGLLEDVLTFIGIEDHRLFVSSQSQEVVNPTKSRGIPDKWRELLLDVIGDEREAARARFDVDWQD